MPRMIDCGNVGIAGGFSSRSRGRSTARHAVHRPPGHVAIGKKTERERMSEDTAPISGAWKGNWGVKLGSSDGDHARRTEESLAKASYGALQMTSPVASGITKLGLLSPGTALTGTWSDRDRKVAGSIRIFFLTHFSSRDTKSLRTLLAANVEFVVVSLSSGKRQSRSGISRRLLPFFQGILLFPRGSHPPGYSRACYPEDC